MAVQQRQLQMMGALKKRVPWGTLFSDYGKVIGLNAGAWVIPIAQPG